MSNRIYGGPRLAKGSRHGMEPVSERLDRPGDAVTIPKNLRDLKPYQPPMDRYARQFWSRVRAGQIVLKPKKEGTP